ncbi:hypothetical protein KSS87_013858 [Heliosperma pusillum]|nr:hypothetical protein KSS87_013858 [Heliosperma pusillum]
MAEPTAAFMAESEIRGITASASAFVNNVQVYLDQLGLDVNSTLVFSNNVSH